MLTGLVPANTPQGTLIHNVASGISPTAPVVSAFKDTMVNTDADLSITKDANPSLVIAGELLLTQFALPMVALAMLRIWCLRMIYLGSSGM